MYLLNNFFLVKRKRQEKKNESGSEEEKEVTAPTTSTFKSQADLSSSCNKLEIEDCFDNDLDKWIGRSSLMTTPQKIKILKRCRKPLGSYDFTVDAIHLKRKFKYSCL